MSEPKKHSSIYRDIGYTTRRYFVDEFYCRHISGLTAGSRVLDLGGKKVRKRGNFDVDEYGLDVVCANISEQAEPDVIADATDLPFDDEVFDAVICSELLEHVYDHKVVLSELFRVLKGDGECFVTVPFLVNIHSDPHDYSRHTDEFWQLVLSEVGFSSITVEKQGLFWCVILDMFRGLAVHLGSQKRLLNSMLRGVLRKGIMYGRKRVIASESMPENWNQPFVSNFTTGFGITAVKKKHIKE